MTKLYSVAQCIDNGWVVLDHEDDTGCAFYNPKNCKIVWGEEGVPHNKHTIIETLMVEKDPDGLDDDAYHAFTRSVGDPCEGEELQVFARL